jgi:hypothetical protein
MELMPVNQSKENGSFKYDNNISFSYTVPEYNKYLNVEYQLCTGRDFKRNGVSGCKTLNKFLKLAWEIILL